MERLQIRHFTVVSRDKIMGFFAAGQSGCIPFFEDTKRFGTAIKVFSTSHPQHKGYVGAQPRRASTLA